MKRSLFALAALSLALAASADPVGVQWVAIDSEFEVPHETFAIGGEPVDGYRLKDRASVWIRLDRPAPVTTAAADFSSCAGGSSGGGCGNEARASMAKSATVYFPFASTHPVDVSALDLLFPISDSARIDVVGRTDSVGSAAFNQRLSERRAASVAGALVDRGAHADRVTTSGKGELDPVASNATRAGRAQNRQAHIEVKP